MPDILDLFFPSDVSEYGDPGIGGGVLPPGITPQIRRPTPRTPSRMSTTAIPRGRTGIGLDTSRFGIGDWLTLAMNPQALGLLQLIQGMKQADADREFQRSQYERANQMQDLQTTIQLNQMGAAPVEEGIAGDFRAGLGGQKPVETPVGRYVLPSAQKQREQAYQDYTRQESAKAIAAAQMVAIRATATAQAKAEAEPKVPLAPDFIRFFKLGWAKELPRSVVESMVHEYNAVNEKETRRVIANNDGTLSTVRVGATGATVERIAGGPVRPSVGALTEGQRLMQGERESRRQEKLIDDAALVLSTAQEAIDNANAVEPVADGPQHQSALRKVEQAVRDFPDLLEGGSGEGNFPYIKWKGGARPRSMRATPQTGNKMGGKVFPASRLAEFAKGKNMDVNAARSYIVSKGYSIAEDQ